MTERIRLLIVDDSTDTREHLTRLLGFEADLQVVGWAASGEQALELVERLPVDVILLDVNMPGLGGMATAEQLAARAPAAAVVMMSVQNESSYLRSAMRAGAREFLVKPFSSEELVTAVRQAYERGRELLEIVAGRSGAPSANAGQNAGATPARRSGQVVSLFAPKGGVGRTTLAVNLAVAAAALGQRVALVDASLQFGDVGVLLNLDPRSRSVVEVVRELGEEDAEAAEKMLVEHRSGVHVLLAPPSPELAETVGSEQLAGIVASLRAAFDLVVVDAPVSLTDTTLALLDGSDVILCLLTLEITSIKNARHFLNLAERLGYPPTKVQLLLNRADAGYGIRLAELESSLGRKVSHTVVSDGRTVVSALNKGEPFAMAERRSRVGRDVARLARALVEGTSAESAAPAREPARRAFAWRAR
jgi:pilus assembly protein CpaE